MFNSDMKQSFVKEKHRITTRIHRTKIKQKSKSKLKELRQQNRNDNWMAITMDYLAFRSQYCHIAMMSNLYMNKHVHFLYFFFYSKRIQP